MKLPLRDFAEIVEGLKGPSELSPGAEKRSANRMHFSARIDLLLIENSTIGRSFSVLTRDISLTGIGLFQTVPLQQGREVLLALPRRVGPIYVASKVMHCRMMAEGILALGLNFSRILEEDMVKKLMASDAAQMERLRKSILD